MERATLRDGDAIQVGKHVLSVDTANDAALPVDGWRKTPVPKVDETQVLDTRVRREMMQQASRGRTTVKDLPARASIPKLTVMRGSTDQREYMLSGKLTVIGRSEMASVRLRGWFAPQAAAQIHKREDGFYLGVGDRIPKINGLRNTHSTRLHNGDIIEIGRIRLHFGHRD